MIVAGVDLSLTATGVCLVSPEGSLLVERFTSKPQGADLASRSLRLRSLAARVYGCVAGRDLIVVEGPSYGSDSPHTWDRAGLWWLLVGRLTGTGHRVIEVPPSTLKTYATGAGNADKDRVLAAVVRRYPDANVQSNDEADALVLAAIGRRALGHPIDDIPQSNLRAMGKVPLVPRYERTADA